MQQNTPQLIKLSSEMLELIQLQSGCITRNQALGFIGQKAWDRATQGDLFDRLHHELYVLRGFPQSWSQRLWSAHLSVPSSVATGASAAFLYGVDLFGSEPPITLLANVNKAPFRCDARIMVTEQEIESQRLENGMKIATPERTVIDLFATQRWSSATAALDILCNAKVTTPKKVKQSLNKLSTRGMRGISRLRITLRPRLIDGFDVESQLEKEVAKKLKSMGIGNFESQAPLRVGGSRYRVDFFFRNRKTILEVDGPHHLLPAIAERDRRRDFELHKAGYIVHHYLFSQDIDKFMEYFTDNL